MCSFSVACLDRKSSGLIFVLSCDAVKAETWIYLKHETLKDFQTWHNLLPNTIVKFLTAFLQLLLVVIKYLLFERSFYHLFLTHTSLEFSVIDTINFWLKLSSMIHTALPTGLSQGLYLFLISNTDFLFFLPQKASISPTFFFLVTCKLWCHWSNS